MLCPCVNDVKENVVDFLERVEKQFDTGFICISDVILLYFALKILLFCIDKNCRK